MIYQFVRKTGIHFPYVFFSYTRDPGLKPKQGPECARLKRVSVGTPLTAAHKQTRRVDGKVLGTARTAAGVDYSTGPGTKSSRRYSKLKSSVTRKEYEPIVTPNNQNKK